MPTHVYSPTQIDRVVTEAFNQGRYDVVEALYADSFEPREGSPTGETGPDLMIAQIEAMREAFPDIEMTVEDQLVADDLAVVHFSWTGTHEGDWTLYTPEGVEIVIEATGETVEDRGIVLNYLEDGKIVSSVLYTESLELFASMDAIETVLEAH